MRILLINGPNINMLGIREPGIYGNKTYEDLIKYVENHARENDVNLTIFQSNHEGEIVDIIQDAYNSDDAIIINPAAYTHTSIAILDALKAVGLPAVEVHLSKVSYREDFRQVSYPGLYCEKTIEGLGFEGYVLAMDYLIEKYGKVDRL
ncbi:type II 3-dehydroquinate dehydratase [Microaceticoccus formicicus]|uniref:type II 3-dehydroquinate dehydratase n=1 Tax=Microaceticoccus formicicus TaxID=3118105 RepID=UPI003CCFFA98|nr:type II 3-dehydroquinate dehydratase [Peptoniphilaceae bacterium AMB_02]